MPLAAASIARHASIRATRATCSRCSTAPSTARVGGEFDAIVTAPVHKGVINDAGIAFTGHTEYLARAHAARRVPVMLLVAGELRVALATTHLPLKDVSAAITIESLCETATILDARPARAAAASPRRASRCAASTRTPAKAAISGARRLDVIAPAIARLRERRHRRPRPAAGRHRVRAAACCADFDAVLAMYHDQGLPVIKHAGFERAVNVTLGLPIVRTSVDHGTALDLAGTGRADPASLAAAVQLASRLARQRH